MLLYKKHYFLENHVSLIALSSTYTEGVPTAIIYACWGSTVSPLCFQNGSADISFHAATSKRILAELEQKVKRMC